jgi:hypothetical protein
VASRSDSEIEKQLQSLFARARELPVPQDPFLSTRVLAEYRARSRGPARPSFWKWLALVSTACSLVLITRNYYLSQGFVYSAAVNQAIAVRVEIEDLKHFDIAHAEIELPDGVHFYSKQHPEVFSEKSVTVAWNQGSGRTRFPIVIKSDISGKKTVRVSFFDSNDKLVATRDVEIRFL